MIELRINQASLANAEMRRGLLRGAATAPSRLQHFLQHLTADDIRFPNIERIDTARPCNRIHFVFGSNPHQTADQAVTPLATAA
jgi:hypothetical protein